VSIKEKPFKKNNKAIYKRFALYEKIKVPEHKTQ
jgi:hypothetical protein